MTRKSIILSIVTAATVLLMASCSQSVYVLDMEARSPSESGLSLSGKTMSLVYLESADGTDSLYNNRVADALAYKLESEYFDGEEAVKVYNLVKDPSGDYSSKDTLSQFIMMLDKDVVMILDTPVFMGKTEKDLTPVSSTLYVYDSMADGEVVTLTGRTSVASQDVAVSRAAVIGGALATPLIGRWVKEQFVLIYYEDANSKWIHALELADEMKWAEAIEIWMEYATAKDTAKASSAKYNIALGCYVLEQYDLALAWLKSSDDTYPLSLSQGLRSRIKSKMKD